ncbi:MAG: flagellar motor protein MotA, partial [Rhodospirillaceae bacterium]|nr:flagellar motor protein MotA [Rhodospirillaceae bacterium]
ADSDSNNHLRSIDHHVSQLVEETGRGREALIAEIRNEIKLLARTIVASKE